MRQDPLKRNYLLLTPGPLSTSATVREAMLQDWCTWDKDYNEGIVTPIREGLLAIAGVDESEYTDVLLQGSGTYCVEATIGAAVRPGDKLLILANGAYGKRMAQIADYYHINYALVSLHETELVTGEVARRALEARSDWVAYGASPICWVRTAERRFSWSISFVWCSSGYR